VQFCCNKMQASIKNPPKARHLTKFRYNRVERQQLIGGNVKCLMSDGIWTAICWLYASLWRFGATIHNCSLREGG